MMAAMFDAAFTLMMLMIAIHALYRRRDTLLTRHASVLLMPPAVCLMMLFRLRRHTPLTSLAVYAAADIDAVSPLLP